MVLWWSRKSCADMELVGNRGKIARRRTRGYCEPSGAKVRCGVGAEALFLEGPREIGAKPVNFAGLGCKR